jgi:hypothetical protein
MPIREFIDSSGSEWRVWDTRPRDGSVYDGRLRRGWLTFECGNVRKRLAPIPRGWEHAPPGRLDLMCRAADPVRRSGSLGLTIDPDASDQPPAERPRDPPT